MLECKPAGQLSSRRTIEPSPGLGELSEGLHLLLIGRAAVGENTGELSGGVAELSGGLQFIGRTSNVCGLQFIGRGASLSLHLRAGHQSRG